MSTPIKVVLLVLVISAGIYDLRIRRIPNWLNLSGIVLGLLVNAFFEPHGLMEAVGGLICALVVYIPLYLVRGMGAGDVKLMAAVGAITGPANWIGIFLATAILGGIASLVLVAAKGRFRQTASNIGIILAELAHRRLPTAKNERLDIRDARALRMPHGAFIASGAMLFLFLMGWTCTSAQAGWGPLCAH
jgi:prepilin peptidase CpaA